MGNTSITVDRLSDNETIAQRGWEKPGSDLVVGLLHARNTKTIYILLVLILKGPLCWDQETYIQDLHWQTSKFPFCLLSVRQRKEEAGEPKQMQGERAQTTQRSQKTSDQAEFPLKITIDLFLQWIQNLDTSLVNKSLVISFKGGASQGRKNATGHWLATPAQRHHSTWSPNILIFSPNNNTQRTTVSSRRFSELEAQKSWNCVCPVRTLQWKLITRWGREPRAPISTA